MCFYPPDLATDANLPPHLLAMLDKNGMILVTVFIENMQVCHLWLLREVSEFTQLLKTFLFC